MAAMRPSLQLLGTSSSKCFFSYHYNMKTFQIGYLGIGPSRISGGFHLRYPTSSPIHISKITATLIGQESVTFIFHDDVQNKKNIFYSQTQFNNIPFSQDIIKYKIVITIFRKCNIFKLQGKNKIVSTICQIDRYSLPSVIKSRNTGGLLMYRTDSNKVSPNSKLDLVQAEALLTSEYIDMNSIMVIPLSLDLPDSIMKIEKIYVVIKEYQTFKEFGRDKEIVYFNDSQKILDYTLLGEEIEITKFINNKCLIELKLDIPAFDCTNNKFQAFEGVRIMKYFNVRHVLKIKIKFENEGQLVLKRDVWLQRSLSEKKILKGRENGSIY
ncbi:17176_t:CDS:2 [Rhizophagus irregularis]|nr:17176_t:CDS:2 [Rhizophagus irregularis]